MKEIRKIFSNNSLAYERNWKNIQQEYFSNVGIS